MVDDKATVTALRIIGVATIAWLAGWLFAPPAGAQGFDVLGPNKCINCHDHDDEKEWWEKEDGPPPEGHVNALKQMENPDSPKYAGAVGLDASVDGVYDLNGSCVTCHATVFKGDANAGISCESCHGPGGGYLDSHQEEDSYQDSLAKGMTDVIEKPEEWAIACITCHVMDDQRLVDAGHPSGDDFTLADKFDVVARHWSNQYQSEAVATAGAATRQAIIAQRGGGTSAPVLTENTAVPPFEAPSVVLSPEPDAPVSLLAAVPPSVRPPVAAPAPGAPETAIPATATPVPVAPATVAPATPTPAAPAAAAPVRTAVPPPPPPPPPKPTTVVVIDQPPPLPRSPAAIVAAIQGRAVVLLDRLLRREGRAPVRVTPPEPSTDYRGADAELLRLQQEVLALAVEALGTAPQAPEDADAEPPREP